MKKIMIFLAILGILMGTSTLRAKDSTATHTDENKLKLTYPNGGETFPAGGDINITWEGVFANETVQLEYSTDGGASWNIITDRATGLKYKWENIPYEDNADYLIRVSKIDEIKPGDLKRTISCHELGVIYLCWSPDGTKIATASADHTAKIWDAKTGMLLHTFNQHCHWIYHLCWSPDGTKIATASADYTAKIWDVKTGKLLHSLEAHFAYLRYVEWNPAGTKVATASYDGTVKIWDVETGSLLESLEGTGIDYVRWSLDGSKIYASGNTSKPKIWDVKSGLLLGYFNNQNYSRWSPDGTKLATSTDNDGIKIWDANSGNLLKTLIVDKTKYHKIRWSPDGTKLAVGGDNDAIHVWDVKTEKIMFVFEMIGVSTKEIYWSPDGTKLATTNRHNPADIYDVESGKKIHSFLPQENSFYRLSWNPNGDQIVFAGGEEIAEIWNIDTESNVARLLGHTKQINSVALHPSRNILVTASYDGTAKVWDIDEGSLLKSLNHTYHGVKKSNWSHDGSKIATSGGDTLRIWDGLTYEIIDSMHATDHLYLGHIVWSPDDKKIAITSYIKQAEVLDVGTGKVLLSLDNENGLHGVSDISWSDDGKRIVTNEEGILQIWDANTGEVEFAITDVFNYVLDFSYNHKGNKIATSIRDSVIIRDAINFEAMGKLIGHTWSVNSVDWSNDDSKILTASADKTAKIWDSNTGIIIRNLEEHKAAVSVAKWSHNNKLIATISEDGIARIWDAETGKSLYVLDSKRRDIYKIYWTFDDKYLVIQGREFVKIWYTGDGYSNTQSDTTDASFSIIQSQHTEEQVPISNISPNPTDDILNIKLDLTEKGNTSLAIYDTEGKRVLSIFEKNITNLGEYNISEDLTNLAIGSYTLVLTTPGNVYTESLKIVR